MEIQSHGRRLAVAIRGAAQRVNRIHSLQLPPTQLGISVFQHSHDGHSSCRRTHLCLKSTSPWKVALERLILLLASDIPFRSWLRPVWFSPCAVKDFKAAVTSESLATLPD